MDTKYCCGQKLDDNTRKNWDVSTQAFILTLYMSLVIYNWHFALFHQEFPTFSFSTPCMGALISMIKYPGHFIKTAFLSRGSPVTQHSKHKLINSTDLRYLSSVFDQKMVDLKLILSIIYHLLVAMRLPHFQVSNVIVRIVFSSGNSFSILTP